MDLADSFNIYRDIFGNGRDYVFGNSRTRGAERRGVLGLKTTRGDRLFITLLGSVYIFLAWLGLMGMPLWGPVFISLAWAVFCFAKV